VARDGTGGLAYLKDVGGVPHVFVSQLLGGVFSSPVELDSTLVNASSDPVIAAGNDGMLLVAFVNSGGLYVDVSPSGPAAFGGPKLLFANAGSPTVGATYLDKGYVAFTADVGGVEQVRAAYYWHGVWGLEPTALNAVATENAGTGSGSPVIAASQDGVATVAWGEAGHVYLRRVWGTAPSVAVYQVDVPSLSGESEISATDPQIGSGGDSSYVDVAFKETFLTRDGDQTRVLLHRLVAGQWSAITYVDGLPTPGTESAAAPGVDMGEFGEGLATAERGTSNQVWGMIIASNGTPTSPLQLDSLPNATPPDPVSAASGYRSALVAWQHDPGPSGLPEIRTRFYTNAEWGPEVVLSSPADGATDAAAGLAAAGDLNADMAVAWVQGTGVAAQIVTDQLYQPPGGFSAVSSFRYVRSAHPLLSWSPAGGDWPPRYDVFVNGSLVDQTSATSIRYGPLTQGPHVWRIEAVNAAGLTSADKKAATVFVDTYPPAVTLSVTGTRQVGKEIHLYVKYSDTPPGGTAADGSGVASVVVNWGDGSKFVITHGKYHAYARKGRYRVTVAVTDQAGNRTTKSEELVIKPKPKPKRPRRRRR
jgi:hypothetical protein